MIISKLPLSRSLHVATMLILLLTLTACNDYFFSDEDIPSQEPTAISETGRYTLTSSDIEREYYIQLPADYDPDAEPLPLLIALHGAGDSIEGWLEGGFQGDGLLQLTADKAIMVIPNARPMDEGRRIWKASNDIDKLFFLELLAELGQRVTFDEWQIFVTGHSAGALMAHELGCSYGDIIRAIAPSAGALDTEGSPRCVGSVAVMQIQSEFDNVIPVTVTTSTRDLWVLYNGFDPEVSIDSITDASITEPCVDYGLGASAYPVQWCLHPTTEEDGHGWWVKADQAIWDFFSGLPIVEPTEDPPLNGGNTNLTRNFPTTLSVTLNFPEGMAPVERVGLFFYPEGSTLPISGAPTYFANGDVDLDDPQPGTEESFVIPIGMPPEDVLPTNLVLVFAVYVEGGTFYIPTAGVDHNAIYPITISDSTTPIVIEEVIYIVPVPEGN
jgi:poly(3-hydroxybutyrate) depolymerase